MSAPKTCPQCGSEYELDVKFCPKDGTTLRVPTGGGLEGSVLADRYHVLRKLGEGGMGQVYLAEHVKMGRKSAIKVMNPSMSQDPDAIGRFNREAANASRISHNNVCAIYDFGETPEGLIYLAMEYIEGESLTKIMEREGALAPARAADITRQVADALDAAHDIGIVHRDLKPDNIMIAKHRDGSDIVKVVDFGIAKAAHGEGQKVTKTGLVVGTPEYMSPEQLAGDQLDGRSDLYTLALVTFNMLTGTLPFPSTTLQESMIMRLTDRPRTLSEMRPDITWPAPLQAVLDRALQRKAEDRYQRAGHFGVEVLRALKGMPTAATQVGVATPAAPGEVPATLVRGGDAGAGGGATGAAPAAAPGVAAAQAAGVPASRKRGALVPMAVVAGVAVIGAVAWTQLRARHAAGGGAGVGGTPPVVAMADSAPGKTTPGTARADSGAASGARADGTHADSARGAAPASQTASDSAKPASSSGKDSAAPPARAPRRSTTSGAGSPTKPARDASRQVQQYSRAERPGTSAPPVAPPQPSAPASSSSTTSASPAGGAGTGAAADEFAGDLDAARARAAVRYASTLLEKQETDRALVLLGRAMKSLPTLDDSITALYHVSEGLLQRSEKTGNAQPKQRACIILGNLRRAKGHPYAASIAYLFSQECQ